jgi:hypothetical protein
MLKKTIICILISCLVFSPVFAKESPNSFNVKIEYIYTEGNRMIVSWNEGQEKHTLYPVTEGGNPINLLNYYKAGELYPASNPTTQMRVYDNSNNPHLFNLDTNAGTGQAAPQAAPQRPPKNQPDLGAYQAMDDMANVIIFGSMVAVLLFIIIFASAK